jgi:hypothetical protein
MAGTRHYRHTQIGWVTIVALLLLAGLLAPPLAATRVWGLLGLVLVILLVSAALFATLTVEVDQHQLRFRFGPGLIGKKIDLADIRHFAPVRNSLWYGWGIHFTPRGVVYNVSGLGAVELHLQDGRRLRIGSDEPEALCRALEQVLGPCEPLSATEVVEVRRRTRRALIALVSAFVLIGLGIAAIFYFHEQPPKVSLSASRIRVASALYSEQLALTEITHLSLERRLPRIRLRTNGYAAGETLRGHFRLDRLGDGQLFIEYGHPPYILIRSADAYVVVNFEDPDETIALYHRLEPLWRAARARGE